MNYEKLILNEEEVQTLAHFCDWCAFNYVPITNGKKVVWKKDYQTKEIFTTKQIIEVYLTEIKTNDYTQN